MLHTLATDVNAELMLRARNHDDSESFGLLLAGTGTSSVQYLTRVVQNRAVAEELAQDVFIRIYRSRHCYEPSARFSTWLYRIATNVALNHLRDQKRHLRDISLDVQETDRVRREAPDQGPLIEDELVREARARQIRRAIQALPPEAAHRRDPAQVSGTGLRPDRHGAGMHARRGQSADVPGL